MVSMDGLDIVFEVGVACVILDIIFEVSVASVIPDIVFEVGVACVILDIIFEVSVASVILDVLLELGGDVFSGWLAKVLEELIERLHNSGPLLLGQH